MKKINCLSLILALGLLLSSNLAFAASYTRPNGFVNASGQEKVHQIKKFQAANNLEVTGGLNNATQDMLHNPSIGPVDRIEKAPSSGYWIAINKSKRILTVYKGRTPKLRFPVAVGTKYTPTPSVKGKIANMHKNPAWGGMGGKYKPRASNDPLNPLGERWMGLAIPGKTGYGIHGTIKPNEIGTYASNGCIRMFNYDIETHVFPLMNVGDPVWIGSESELKSWGLSQGVEKISGQSNPGEKTPDQSDGNQKNPVDRETKKKQERGVDLLNF